MPSIGTASALGFYFTGGGGEPEFPNGDFNNGITGWTVADRRIQMFGQSILAGYPTPPDPNPRPYNSTGDATYASAIYSWRLSNDVPPGGVQSVRLTQSGTVNSLALLYGPAIFSDFFVNFNTGDICQFNWKATGESDAYNIFAYMVEKDTGSYVTLLRATQPSAAPTPWQTQNTTVNTSGNYRFVFVSGSWDASGGQILGSSLLIDNIKRVTF